MSRANYLSFGKWLHCPICDSRNVVDISADNARAWEFECLSCAHTWEQMVVEARVTRRLPAKGES